MEIAGFETADKTGAVDLCYCRATIYSALALAFRPPVDETVARIIEPETSAALAVAAALIDIDGKLKLAGAIDALAAAGRAAVSTLASSHRALFGHTARGIVAPYETEYGNEALFQQPQELGDLMGFYRAFGLAVRLDRHERADHISCECEFLAFLAMKEAYALEHHDAAMLEDTVHAQKLFLRDHLGRFLPTFTQQLGREHAAGFYAKLADLCLRFVSQETNRLGIRLGAANLPLRPATDERVPMACGSGAECAAMPGACVPEGADSI
ncbi:MAG TPA: molecular chaperone TorD family protein [Candidatus Binatia bacterium]|jgi:DMSO reductase family type II enzyme chaperone|nr:molecular chaperone TorD family protein [Candidatus Binatia bacterium]